MGEEGVVPDDDSGASKGEEGERSLSLFGKEKRKKATYAREEQVRPVKRA